MANVTVAGIAGLALVLTSASTAAAQSGDAPSSLDNIDNPAVLDPASVEGSLEQFDEHGVTGSVPNPESPVGSMNGVPSGSIAGSSYLSTLFPLGSVLGGADSVGSADFHRPGGVPDTPINQRDPNITETEFTGDRTPLYSSEQRAANPELGRAEVWYVNSESMGREIRLEVFHAPDDVEQAPIVYFLGGVGAEEPTFYAGVFGFNNPEALQRPVTVVAPTRSASSMFADWERDDEILGSHRWETFLTEELPPLLEGHDDIASNGHYGTLGLSMGGGPAVHLANNHDMFGAAAGISSCYSSTDPIGYQYNRLTVEAMGGDATNMWGPRDSAEWQRHDTASDPGGLAGKRVYLSAATGYIGSTDLSVFGRDESIMIDGHLLERGAYECTVGFERTLQDAGVEHRVDYEPFGIHNWPVFGPPLNPAMEYMLPALGEPVYATSASGVAVDALESAGSSGSAASVGRLDDGG